MQVSDPSDLRYTVLKGKITHTDVVEPHFVGRKEYTSKATHDELGADFFPEGSQRVYVNLSC